MTKQFTCALTIALMMASTHAISAEATKKSETMTANLANGKSKAETVCAACHGADGNSTNNLWPKLAGQHSSYIEKQLHDYINDRRYDPVMTAMAKPLTDQDVIDVAAYFSAQAQTAGTGDETKVEEGRLIYKGGDLAKGITACAGCHGPGGDGNPASKYPRISGQHAEYIVKTLKDFRAGNRNNSPANMMGDIAKRMTDEQIEAVSEYIAGLRD